MVESFDCYDMGGCDIWVGGDFRVNLMVGVFNFVNEVAGG